MAFGGPRQPPYFNLQRFTGSNQCALSINEVFTCSTGQIQTTTLLHLTRFYRVVLYLVSVPISRFTGCLQCRSNLVLQVIYSVEMQYLYAIRMTGCCPRCLHVFFHVICTIYQIFIVLPNRLANYIFSVIFHLFSDFS